MTRAPGFLVGGAPAKCAVDRALSLGSERLHDRSEDPRPFPKDLLNRSALDRRSWRRLLPGLLMVAGAMGCDSTSPEPPLFVGITEIEVTGVTDAQPLSDVLEVEVHLFDARTEQSLRC